MANGGPDGSPTSPKVMKFKELLVGKGGPDGSPSGPKAMEFKYLLVGKGGPDGRESTTSKKSEKWSKVIDL